MKKLMSLEFYDRKGMPVAYTDDDEHIYSFDGRPVAYFYSDSVYSYRGRHLGYFRRGIIHDNGGLLVLITPDSMGGTLKPLLRPLPTKDAQRAIPTKKSRRPRSEPPIFLTISSRTSPQQFFPEVSIKLVYCSKARLTESACAQ
jgi:hypothetical protein